LDLLVISRFVVFVDICSSHHSQCLHC
jgi:hypothetical protein